MEDFNYKWIVYLVVGLIYFFARSKKKNQPTEGRDNRPSAPANKPISFEDLLREIQSGKQTPQHEEPKPQHVYRPEPKPQPISKTYPQYEDYDDNLEEEGKVLENTRYDYRKQDNIYDVYEKAKLAAFERPSLEETMNIEDTVVRFGQFKEYQKVEEFSLASLVAKDFENPENIRKAFVMSEILNRKY